MAASPPDNGLNTSQEATPSLSQYGSQRPTEALRNTQSTSNALPLDKGERPPGARRKRTRRGGRNKRNRRQSFATPSEDAGTVDPSRSNHDLLDVPGSSTARPPLYKLGQSGGRNFSSTSLDSQALLDHRYGLHRKHCPQSWENLR